MILERCRTLRVNLLMHTRPYCARHYIIFYNTNSTLCSSKVFSERSSIQLAIVLLMGSLPVWAMKILQGGVFRPEALVNFKATGQKIALDILQREIHAVEGSLPEGKDIMSILGKSHFLLEP